MREYFIKTQRLGFSTWNNGDFELANQLWGDPEVTRFICAAGRFTPQEITERLLLEVHNGEQYGVQYWPIFALDTNAFLGCCGLRPFQGEANAYELGFHLCRQHWGMGYAFEGATAAMQYGFETIRASKLYAGHHPANTASEKLLTKLGFHSIGTKFYEPTGLYHPSYELCAEEKLSTE